MTHRLLSIGIDPAFGPDRTSVMIGETMPDGTVNVIEVDDVVSVQRWGDGLVLRMETRDPVIVRADGTCELLVTG